MCLKNGIYSKYVMSPSYCCCGYYSFTPGNPNEHNNTQAEHCGYYYAQSVLVSLVVKTHIVCNYYPREKIDWYFINILEYLSRYSFPSTNPNLSVSES